MISIRFSIDGVSFIKIGVCCYKYFTCELVATRADLVPLMRPITELLVAPHICLVGIVDEGAVIVTLHGIKKQIPSRLLVYDFFPWNADVLLGLRVQRRLRLSVKHYEGG